MKRQIVFSLSALFLLFALGSAVALFNIQRTTDNFSHLIRIHQVEELRNELIHKVLKVQSDLYTVNTPLGHNLDDIVANVFNLEVAAERCTTCHHQAETLAGLSRIQTQVGRFKDALSFYITTSANREKIEQLKMRAAKISAELLNQAERMSFIATQKSKGLIEVALREIAQARQMLYFALLATLLFGTGFAIYLTRAITRPVAALVAGTRQLAAGNLGYTLGTAYRDEFAELAKNFNAMSASLKVGQEDVLREIAERKQTEQALRKSEERYALASQGANDGLWDWDLEAEVIYFSPRWKAMLGYAEEEIGNQPGEWFGRVHPEDLETLRAQIAAHLAGQTRHFKSEYRLRDKQGEYRWVSNRAIAVREAAEPAHRMVGSQADVTERKLVEERLKHDAFHDALTGLPNRALFMDRLQQTMKTVQRGGDEMFAAMFLDLDRFKVINDSLGHFVGDQVLIAVANRLARLLRPGDTVARLGGDEFAILLGSIADSSAAIHIAERIQAKIPVPLQIDEHEIFTTVSTGIVICKGEHQDPDRMVREADLAMYQAKTKGKNRYEIFDKAMHQSVIFNLQMENDLRKAVQHKEFYLHYQPIFALNDQRLVGCEALVRWQHPEQGVIYPSDFIPLAEETGLIAELGSWVLRQAAEQVMQWQKGSLMAPCTMNVNLSGKEFTPALLDKIKQIIAETGIDPRLLRLEITETAIMDSPELSLSLLQELKKIGIGLQIDDFGTGYSSLSYLHQFPIDALKIDRSFVMRMIEKPENLEIVKSIIELAHNLKIAVIAEGVESEEELTVLQSLRCEYAQGHYVSRPLTADQAAKLWADGRLQRFSPR